MDWINELEPIEAGWYAVHYCWDAAEGSFLTTLYFDGSKWDSEIRVPVFQFAGPFSSEEEAEKFCEDNDISF